MTKPRLSKRERKVRRKRRGRAKFEAKLAELRAATDRRFRELGAIIRADIHQLFDADSQPKRIQDLPADLRLAIADCEVDPTTGRIMSVVLKDKIDAAEELLRFMGEAEKPEVMALLKAARQNQRRVATIMSAIQAMNEERPPPKLLN